MYQDSYKTLQSKRVAGIINSYLIGIDKTFFVYFPETEAMNDSNDWVTEPFSRQVVYSSLFSVKLKEHLVKLLADRTLEIFFDDRSLCDILAYNSEEYQELSDDAIIKFLPFPSTYLCAQGFAVFISINVERNRIDAQLCFLLAVIFIHKHMNQLKMKPVPSISL